MIHHPENTTHTEHIMNTDVGQSRWEARQKKTYLRLQKNKDINA